MADKEQNLNPNQNQSLQCPVCGETLAFLIARGRKSGKPFLMVKCLRDGRHFRGFVGDRDYVEPDFLKLVSCLQFLDYCSDFW